MVSTSSERRALGDRLKRHRERRGISLSSISQSTKIPASLFQGLERGDCSRWPAGIYSRAYVRAYAEAIGLNPEEIVEDFVSAYGSLQGDGHDAPTRARSGGLRLSIVEESGISPEQIVRRTAMAGVELLTASALGWAVYSVSDAAVLLTVGSLLAYQTVTRLVTDEPLLWWAFRRLRTGTIQPAPAEDTAEVAVADAASTAA